MLNSWSRRASALVLAGLLIAACGGGDGEQDEASAGDAPSETTAGEGGGGSTEAEPSTTEEEVFMPDLIGQTEDEARETLGDIGVDDSIQVVERESLEEAGTIIDQVPSSGQRISGSVNLVVAKPVGPVPDFVGQQISEVEEWAEERAIEVRTEEVLDDTLADGEVVGTTPAADEDATSEILVQVARTPVISQLAEIDSVDNTCEFSSSVGEAQVNGESYPNSLIMSSSECVLSYDLSRDWTRFKATIGNVDTSDAGVQFRFEVVADGTSLFNEVIGLGSTTELDVDVSDRLRLELRVTATGSMRNINEAVWGDARLIGSPEAVGEASGDEGGSTTTTTP
jgi:hypothetical protein